MCMASLESEGSYLARFGVRDFVGSRFVRFVAAAGVVELLAAAGAVELLALSDFALGIDSDFAGSGFGSSSGLSCNSGFGSMVHVDLPAPSLGGDSRISRRIFRFTASCCFGDNWSNVL